MEPKAEQEPTWITLAGDKDEIDLFLVCDTTGSMGTYLPALKASLRQVFLVAKLLFHGRLMVHIVSYKDYCDANGLLSTVSRRTSRNDAIVKFVDDLKPTGGGDFPEAVKTALNHVIMTVDDIRATVSATSRALVFLYTDAPPHHQTTRSNNQSREIEAIQDNPKYRGGHDWFQLQRTLQDLGIPVYTFHSPTRDYLSPSFYGAMGPTVILPQLSSTIITEATMGLLLQLMAQTFEVTIGSNFARSSFTHKGEPFDQSFSAQDETDIPPASSLVVTNETFVFAPLEWMKVDLNGLLPLFGRDADFRNLVMKTFEVIFRPENVLSVTYNPIFGKLWRLCCRQRLDPRLDDLTAKLSQCVPMLTGGAKVQVSEWLEESYNDSQRIRDAIANAAPLGPCFTLDIGHLSMSKASIRSLARAPQPGVLEGVQNILARLQYHQSPPAYSDKEDDDLMYLPLSLSNEYLFSFLPHLMFPGTTLSQRGAALVALVCCLSNHIHLINRAAEYLTLIQGTWLPFDYAVEFPEIFSAEFVQLLYRGQAYLTPFEQQVYRQLFAVHRLRLAATKDVDVVVGYTPQKDSLWPDRKARCHTCGYDTSLSLMVSPALCAMCVTYGDDAPTLQANTVVSGNESHIVECHDCHGIYAVLQVARLGTAAKCWFCRTNNVPLQPPPKTSCSGCLNQFIDPAGLYRADGSPSNGWLCPVCTDAPVRATTMMAVPFNALMQANPHVAVAHGWTTDKVKSAFVEMVFHTPYDSMFKLFTQKQAVLLATSPTNDPATVLHMAMHFQGKAILQSSAICESLKAIVLTDALRDVCNMCFEEFSLPCLSSACGRCPTKVCTPCLTKWFGAAQPGHLVSPAMLACAFCRGFPTLGVLRKYNRDACALKMDSRSVIEPNMYYGWCLGCYRVKRMMKRDCTRDPPLDEVAFRCAECVDAHAPVDLEWILIESQECPNCHAHTEKAGGCNHITCICGQHWCFECATGFDTAQLVYDHMYTSHRDDGGNE